MIPLDVVRAALYRRDLAREIAGVVVEKLLMPRQIIAEFQVLVFNEPYGEAWRQGRDMTKAPIGLSCRPSLASAGRESATALEG